MIEIRHRMRRVLGVVFAVAMLLVSTSASAQVHVRGYFRSNGTYVQPHYRSAPDGNPYNNWSFPGNVNPYTGKVATGNPDTYLSNYYNRRATGSSSGVPALSEPEPTVPQATPETNSSTLGFYNRPATDSLSGLPVLREPTAPQATPETNSGTLGSVFSIPAAPPSVNKPHASSDAQALHDLFN